MTKKQFRHDFLRGLGSALIELKSCKNPQQYYDIVRYACLHNTTYDMQCEGNHSWYLYQAAVLAGSDSILKDIIKRYSLRFSDDRLFDQLTDILYHFAADGNESIRIVLYDKYNFLLDKLSRIIIVRNKPICPDRDMFDCLCVCLTSLYGWDNFKIIINDVSKNLLPKDSDFFFSRWFYNSSKDKFGEKRVERYLQKQAEKSEYINKYWQKAQAWDTHVYKKQPLPALEDVIAAVDGERYHGRGLSMRFAKNASADDLNKLLQIAMAEQDLQKRAELLWGLRSSSVPLSEEVITELLKTKNEDLHDTAFYIMGNNPSPKMRAYALSLLQNNEDITNAIFLLSKNITPKDEQTFFNAIKSIPVKFEEGDWHNAFMSAEDGIEKLRGKPKTDLLHYIYRETYCGCCRKRIVNLMHKKRVLTESILRECLYDSNEDIREFTRRIIRSKKSI